MKTRNSCITITVLAILVIPSLTYAAWWNPATWFKKPLSVPIVQKRSDNPASPSAKIATTSVASKAQTSAVKKETIVAKPRVDQSSEIEKLKKEVSELKKIYSETPTKTQAQVPTPLTQQPFKTPDPISRIETWEEQETRDFLYADQRGWISLTSTNALGEKRYYRKEGTQWVRKNSEAEAQQPYEPPERVTVQVAFRDNALSAYTRLISILTQYRDMFSNDINGMNNIASLINNSGTSDERFLSLLKLTMLRVEKITKIKNAADEALNHYRSESSQLQLRPLSYFSVNRIPNEITDFFNKLPQMYSSAIADQDLYSASVNKVATPSFIPAVRSFISCSYRNGGTAWSCVDASSRTIISCVYRSGGTELNCF